MKAIKSTSVSDDEVRVLLDRYKCPSRSDAVPRKYRFPSNVSITAAKQEEVPMASQESPSLYERLGGIYSIATVVDDLIDRVMADPRLNANPLVETAIAALAATTTLVSALPSTAQYSIENVEASLDDESSRIEIRVDGQVGVANGNVTLQELSFQVTTLAKL
jgi:hypothetical protein